MILAGKNILITGLLNRWSIAYAVAELAQQEGAEVVLATPPMARRSTERAASSLLKPPPILDLDVRNPDHYETLTLDLERRWGGLDAVLHGIAFAPTSCIAGDFMKADWDDVAVALQISAFSLKQMTAALLPLLERRQGAVVAVDFDSTLAWPMYDWMGVAKATMEATARYLAREIGPNGVRVNLVCAGPLQTTAARSIRGSDHFADFWRLRAPLGWDATDKVAVARACVLLMSDWLPATTGEMLHVDGGVHAVGAFREADLVVTAAREADRTMSIADGRR